jgi:PEP-CTERM motif
MILLVAAPSLRSTVMKLATRTLSTYLSLILLAVVVMTFGTITTRADSTTFSGSGTWGSGAPVSNWSAPGGTWAFSFTVPNPTPVSFFDPPQNTEFITTAISNFSFSFNGAAVNIPAADVIFFPLNQFGGFEIDFTAGGMDTTNNIHCAPDAFCSFDAFGGQFYTGTVPSLTLVPGKITGVDFDYSAPLINGDLNPAGTGTVNSFTGPTGSPAVPEPATVSLLALGLLGIFAKSRKK